MADRQEVIKTPVGAKAVMESIRAEGPVQISLDMARRRIVVKINITGRETDSVVADVQRRLSSGSSPAAGLLRGLFLLGFGVVHRPAPGLTIFTRRHNL
jgi:hypothetical protein